MNTQRRRRRRRKVSFEIFLHVYI